MSWLVLLCVCICLAELDSFLGACVRRCARVRSCMRARARARALDALTLGVGSLAQHTHIHTHTHARAPDRRAETLQTLPNQADLGVFNYLVHDAEKRIPLPAARAVVDFGTHRYDFARDYKGALYARARRARPRAVVVRFSRI